MTRVAQSRLSAWPAARESSHAPERLPRLRLADREPLANRAGSLEVTPGTCVVALQRKKAPDGLQELGARGGCVIGVLLTEFHRALEKARGVGDIALNLREVRHVLEHKQGVGVVLSQHLPAHPHRLVVHGACHRVLAPGTVDDTSEHVSIRHIAVIVSLSLPVDFGRIDGGLEGLGQTAGVCKLDGDRIRLGCLGDAPELFRSRGEAALDLFDPHTRASQPPIFRGERLHHRSQQLTPHAELGLLVPPAVMKIGDQPKGLDRQVVRAPGRRPDVDLQRLLSGGDRFGLVTSRRRELPGAIQVLARLDLALRLGLRDRV